MNILARLIMPFVIFEKNNAGQPPQHVAAPISATPQIASAIHIVVNVQLPLFDSIRNKYDRCDGTGRRAL
jgi:hypothetical protein